MWTQSSVQQWIQLAYICNLKTSATDVKRRLRADPRDGLWMTGRYIFACDVRTFVPHWMEAVKLGAHSQRGYGNIHTRAYGEHVLGSL